MYDTTYRHFLSSHVESKRCNELTIIIWLIEPSRTRHATPLVFQYWRIDIAVILAADEHSTVSIQKQMRINRTADVI
jgi:hypothetical protein